METGRKYRLGASIVLLLFGVLLIGIVLGLSQETDMPNIKIQSPDDASAFLAELGWTADSSCAEIKETVLPEEFDDVLSEYNTLQLQQKLDLKRYVGKPVTIYTLPISNYKGTDNTVYATLIVHKHKVIAGDIHAAEINGFIHGLK